MRRVNAISNAMPLPMLCPSHACHANANPRPEERRDAMMKKMRKDARLEPAEWVRVGDAGTALDVWLHLGRSNPRAGEVPVDGESGSRVEALIDDASHSRITMVPNVLRTVKPHRRFVFHENLEDLAGLALGDREEAGEKGCGILGLAGLGE